MLPSVQRGILRHVFIVLDMSRGMEATDLKPSRAAATVALAKEFVREFFDQNPISSLGVIVTRDAAAAKASEMSGNPRRHVDAIDAACAATSGDMSLQASLELAARNLALLPEYGTREVVLVHGALSTCDAGSIDDTIAELLAARVRVSFVSLPGELYIATRIARETGGDYTVPETADALRAALLAQCAPPPRAAADGDVRARLTLMGFPTLVAERPGLCACHGQLRPRGYVCPRCDARSCELPTQCPVCGLQLVSAPGLARSYHHLFPVPVFAEVPLAGAAAGAAAAAAGGGTGEDADVELAVDDSGGAGRRVGSGAAAGGEGGAASRAAVPAAACSGCAAAFAADEPRYACPDCALQFCDDCDAVIHETLHNCPGCVGAAAH